MAGEPRLTRKGTPLAGTRAESYWSAPLLPNGKLQSDVKSLEDSLSEVAERLSSSRHAFVAIRAEGGGVELFLGIFGNANFGFDLEPDLLSRFGALALSLSFDVYP